MTEFYVFQFVPLVLVEAIALMCLKWGSPGRCLFDSILMNSASFLGLILNLAPQIHTTGPIGITVFCVYSTIVEGVILTLLERHQPEKIWWAALTANVAGCLLIAVEALYLAWREHS